MDAQERYRDSALPDEPPHFYTIHPVYLEKGRILHELYNTPVLNPYDIGDLSLLTANADYMNDLARYINQVDYAVRKLKQERGIS